MRNRQNKPARHGRGYTILMLILTVLLLAVMELNKNTIAGWILVLTVWVAYFILIRRFPRFIDRNKSGITKEKSNNGSLHATEGTAGSANQNEPTTTAEQTAGKQHKSRRFIVLLRIALPVALILSFLISQPPVKAVPASDAAHPEVTDVITVAQGELTGVRSADGAVEIFAGIPYAKPPVGALRWKEPEDPAPWDGVRACDTFAPMSMQPRNSTIYNSLAQIVGYHDYKISLKDNYIEPMSEDSLYLNIWRPSTTRLREIANVEQDAASDATAGASAKAAEVDPGSDDAPGESPASADMSAGLPVLVYIHGGSLKTGQPWYADYAGTGLAKEGVIVVNLGYRLGVFGFYGNEALAAESPNHTTGNYGLLDQIKALEWVRDNIAAFGGDPDNVTLAGESAGSACVSALLASPQAKGLFRRAILESSTVAAPVPAHSFRTFDKTLEAGASLYTATGAQSLNDLRALSAEDLVRYTEDNHHITVDGYVLPKTPYEAFLDGDKLNAEAILNGFNGQESAAFLLFDKVTQKNFEEKLADNFSFVLPATTSGSVSRQGGTAAAGDSVAGDSTIDNAASTDQTDSGTPATPEDWDDALAEIAAVYPTGSDKEASGAMQEILSALWFSYGHFCLTRQAMAQDIPVYEYYFTQQNGRLGNWHSGEEVYCYGNIPADSSLYTDEDRELGRIMLTYWKNFAATGDPKGDVPAWNPVTEAGTVTEFNSADGKYVQEVRDPYLPLYAIFDRMYGTRSEVNKVQ